MENNKRLIPINVSYSEDDNLWTFHPENSTKMIFRTTPDKMKRLLRRMKAKDSVTTPNSKKGTTYQAMMDDVSSKGSSIIYAWKSHCPISQDVIEALMEE